MKRSYYSDSVVNFINTDINTILGELTIKHTFALEDLQRDAWVSQIKILKDQLVEFTDGYVMFEYSIPRMGKRVDVVFINNSIVYLFEFKVGDTIYSNSAKEQVIDYTFDLKNFHDKSHTAILIPVIISTEAEEQEFSLIEDKNNVYSTQNCNKNSIHKLINFSEKNIPISKRISIINKEWEESIYKPTPTIVQAAQALYKGHNVEEISRSDSGAINLEKTSYTIDEIINNSKKKNLKSICFVTGVPGAGKTLAGLNIANKRHNIDEGEHAVFLSGNGPLVTVLQEALARDEVLESKNRGIKINKKESLSKTSTFIQNIHHFRDDSLTTLKAPIEKVAVFDEAQRAWTMDQTKSFMSRKKGISNFEMSEPEFLIDVMDRHDGYAVIICLIGGGQEINTGEAGLPEWFKSINRKFKHWNVHVSNKLTDFEYNNGQDIYSFIDKDKLSINEYLHLSVSVRSFRSEKLSDFVKNVLDNNIEKSKELFNVIKR